MERIWLDDSVCARSFPHTTSACRGGVTPSNRRLAASLSFSKCQRSNSRRTSFLCVTFVAMSTPPSRRMLRHPPLIPPIRLERHRPDRPESKPPHAVGAHIGRHPGLVRVAQAHAVHGTRAPPAAQIARMHILRDQLITLTLERVPSIPLLHGIGERLPLMANSTVSSRNSRDSSQWPPASAIPVAAPSRPMEMAVRVYGFGSMSVSSVMVMMIPLCSVSWSVIGCSFRLGA